MLTDTGGAVLTPMLTDTGGMLTDTGGAVLTPMLVYTATTPQISE